MKSFIIPIVLWSYVLSVLLAKGLWGAIFDKVILVFDLSPSQYLVLPVMANLLVASIGIPQIARFVVALRRRTPVTASRHVASALSIMAMALCVAGAIMGAVLGHERFPAAISESVGTEAVFAAGSTQDGVYSNHLVGLALELPSGWQPRTRNAMRRSKFARTIDLTGGDMQKAYKQAEDQPGVYPLVFVRKYPDGHSSYNPALAVIAYDKRSAGIMKFAALEDFVNDLKQVAPPSYLRGGPKKEKLAAETLYHIHLETRLPRTTIQQHLYFTETERFFISLTANSEEDADRDLMQQAISTLRVWHEVESR